MFRMFPLFRLLRVYTGHPTSRSPKSGKRAIYAGLNVDFKAVCDAVLGAWQGNGETITDVAARFRVSRVGFTSMCTRHSMARESPIGNRDRSLHSNGYGLAIPA